MWRFLWTSFWDVMHRGGPVMWPLLAMSIATVTLIVERAWFWARLASASRRAWVARVVDLFNQGQTQTVRVLAESEDSVYGRLTRALLAAPVSDSRALAVIEEFRPTLDRFMPTLSTIITAAPLLGLLGTVLGLITTFKFMSGTANALDASAASAGLAEALLNTAFGLVITVLTLLPYNAYRAQVDRALGRMEAIAAAACGAAEAARTAPRPQPERTPPTPRP